MEKIADKIIAFNRKLHYRGALPAGFSVLNPFKNNAETKEASALFYRRFYNDNKERKLLLGINPGRHGAALTGVPFTDTKRLETVCGIAMKSARSHELSSVFIYEMIAKYGGAEKFFGDVYINSPFPLAIVKQGKHGTLLNANYYDDTALFEAVKPFMIKSLKQHIQVGVSTRKAFVLGKKNYAFIDKINREAALFDALEWVEHPRFIQQYRSKEKDIYIEKYLRLLKGK